MKDLTGTIIYDSWGNDGKGKIGMVLGKCNYRDQKLESLDDWEVEWYGPKGSYRTAMSRGSIVLFISDYKRFKENN
jgi:hypothetical protein